MTALHIGYKHEVIRKLIHLSSLWIPFAYYFLDKTTMMFVIGFITIIVVWCDVLKYKSHPLRNLVERFLVKIMRTHEQRSMLSGASYVMIASTITIVLFSKIIASVAITVLIISDTVAALVGRRYGRIKIVDKTLEGCMAFFISGIWVVLFFGYLYTPLANFYIVGALAVLVGSIVELYSAKFNVDDNLSIPLSVASSLTLFSFFLSW
jgi:dolichol kinase